LLALLSVRGALKSVCELRLSSNGGLSAGGWNEPSIPAFEQGNIVGRQA